MAAKPALIIRDIPEDLRRKLKILAAKQGRSMREVVINLIKKYVESNNTSTLTRRR